MWLANGSMENLHQEQSTKIPLGNQKNLALMVEERNCHADLYHRRLREANLKGIMQEANHWIDIGAQGEKIDIANCMEIGRWFLGWKLQRRWQERLRNRDQDCRQKMGVNQ